MAGGSKSEVAKIFEGLPQRFQQGKVPPRTFYFSLDEDEKWTVVLGEKACQVREGKVENADCFFKASKQLFLDVWNGKYKPGPMDFVTGKIKSNNPLLLKDFVDAFRKG
jgi:putative sterol carrier protein